MPLTERLIATIPAFAAACALRTAGHLSEARGRFLDLVDRPALTAACLHQLGEIALAQGETDRACSLFQQSAHLAPDDPLLHQRLVETLLRLGQIGPACDRLLNWGAKLQTARLYAQAEPVFRRILGLASNCYAAHINLGHVLGFTDRPREAATSLIRGLALLMNEYNELRHLFSRMAPSLASAGIVPADAFMTARPPAGPLSALGGPLTSLGKALDELGIAEWALEAHRLATKLEPGLALPHINLALSLLRVGDFRNGWREYEWRLDGPLFDRLRRLPPAPLWQGETLTAKNITLIAEQGFGDTLNFLPLVRRIAAMASHTVLHVQPPLYRLLRHNLEDGAARIIVTTDTAEERAVKPDRILPLLSLPYRLDLTQDRLPLAKTYLSALPQDAASWAARLGHLPGPKIGIAWFGRQDTVDNAKRALDAGSLAVLLGLPDITWVCLQFGGGGQALASYPQVVDAGAELHDFGDTAAVIAQLDLVISIDTAVAHLAGAMGCPLWLLLRAHADWRWFEDEARSQWYPNARLFRQRRPGDWSNAVQDIVQALPQWAKENNQTESPSIN